MVVILSLKTVNNKLYSFIVFSKKMKLYENKHQNLSPFEQNIKQCVKKKD